MGRIRHTRCLACGIIAMLVLLVLAGLAQAQAPSACKRLIKADVVALDQAFYNNRMGTLQAGGMIFALRHDVVSSDPPPTPPQPLQPGKVMLRTDKRPRPITLRANVGDCLEIAFQNLLAEHPMVYDPNQSPRFRAQVGDPYTPNANHLIRATPDTPQPPYEKGTFQPATRYAGIHVMGMELIAAKTADGTPLAVSAADGSWVGANDVFADPASNRRSGLVAPNESIVYTLYAAAEGGYLLYSSAADVGAKSGFGGQLSQGLFGTVAVQPEGAEWYRSQVTHDDLMRASTLVPAGPTGSAHYQINYDAVYPGTNKPVLKMLDSNRNIVYSDLTAIITGPNAGRFSKTAVPDTNLALPDRDQPYREFVIHYHDDFVVTQAFPEFLTGDMQYTLNTANDFFAINYGIGGIGAPIWANRLGVGPMHQCATCKFEEFFLSSWPGGDPAMVVDVPANAVEPANAVDPSTRKLHKGPKATKAFYPDDPSNVYHSYMADHLKFRILHAGTNITHVHHTHAHQWLHSPNSGSSHYRDSQMISPGGSYTLEHVYNGSGNVNKTVGDAIFHCHFYPHFAQGMWALWRVHDMFEAGTELDQAGKPKSGQDIWNRALPDGEIETGTPTPAVVPMPTLPMAPLPARVQVVKVTLPGNRDPVGYRAEVHPGDLAKGLNPGFPFFIPGVAGQRAPHPPLDFAQEEDNAGQPKRGADGKPIYYDGGLPRFIGLQDADTYEKHNRWDFTKDNKKLTAVGLPEEGTKEEVVAMQVHSQRKHPSFLPDGTPGDFLLNGLPAVRGAPYANPGITLDGQEVKGIRYYRAADIQLDIVLNKEGWHYPQGRMLALWGDVQDTLDGKRAPEPLFFRANSGEVIEYWLTNLMPSYYELDDFQVRTPTDVLGQHIHLVKFDVTSSDGAGNGFNYEDGSLSPDEVRAQIEAINKADGLYDSFSLDPRTQKKLTPKAIPYFGPGPDGQWVGAQATVQRWYADPQVATDGFDLTLRTIFTHDHFSPSTHQQTGLYAGLVIEPSGSTWLDPVTGQHLGGRFDGGPTSWQANIITTNASDSYREFVLEFQDRQLAYTRQSVSTMKPYKLYGFSGFPEHPDGPWGWTSPSEAIAAPIDTAPAQNLAPFPALITNDQGTGTYSLNYRNEPLPFRVAKAPEGQPTTPEQTDLSHVFRSIKRSDAALNIQPTGPIDPARPDGFEFPPPQVGAEPTDPYTPLLRAYEGDKVQIRTLVGAHMLPHFFTVHGLKWLFEPRDQNSGYRSTQGMGISEHYEMLFTLPLTSSSTPQADYLYVASSDASGGLQAGNWGLLRAYKQPQSTLQPLPNNAQINPATPQNATAGCPDSARKTSPYDVVATTSQQALGSPLVYNARGQQQIVDQNALLYVLKGDLVDPNNPASRLKPDVPVEPLILRAAAGDCVVINLTNALPATAQGGGSAIPGAPFVYTFSVEDTAQHIQQMVSFFNGVPGPKRSYDGRFRTGFNQNPYGFTLPADPNQTTVAQNPNGVGWQIIPPTPQGQTYTVVQRSATRLEVTAGIVITTSRAVGLHPQLVSYDVTQSDGVNAGLNPVHTVEPGKTGTFTWYAGSYEPNGPRPVEFGAIPLTPSDPLMQHPFGLLGALIIEPQGAKARLDDNSRAAATVMPEDPSAPAFRAFREFVIIVQDDLASLQLATPPSTRALTIAGALGGATGIQWVLNGTGLPNNSSVPISPGDTLTFTVQTGQHGITFLNKADAEKVFDFGQPGLPFQAQPGIGPNAWGTNGAGAGTTLATLKVKQNIPANLTQLGFECTVHKQNMAGVLQIGPTPQGSADTSQAVNYRTEPLAYRGVNLAVPAPLGIAQALSDTQVQADPQTPVFAAEAGQPVRIRMLHPAGLSEQVFTLHGHVWQEEPYTRDTTVIGHNPQSQWTGSRDSFGPNVAFDIVLDQAGGKASAPGDYLYRTFIGGDFQAGMWGLLRVGEPGKDVVTVTGFAPSHGKVVIAGVNTVNPANGHMADQVTLFTGTGSQLTEIGKAPVDQQTGAWTFSAANLTPPLTVKSAQGGMMVAPRFIVGPSSAPSVTDAALVAPTPTRPPGSNDLMLRFRPQPRNVK